VRDAAVFHVRVGLEAVLDLTLIPWRVDTRAHG